MFSYYFDIKINKYKSLNNISKANKQTYNFASDFSQP